MDEPVRTTDDDADAWRKGQNTAPSHPGAAGAWVALMALLVGGLALFGVGVSRGEGLWFGAGILACTLAFAVPLELLGRQER